MNISKSFYFYNQNIAFYIWRLSIILKILKIVSNSIFILKHSYHLPGDMAQWLDHGPGKVNL